MKQNDPGIIHHNPRKKSQKKKKTAFKPSFAFESSTVYNDPSAQPKGTTSH
jgi:hypothetical protein